LIVAVLAGGYYWLVVDSRMPGDASYPLDIAGVSKLADSVPGAKPTQLRYEHIYGARFMKGMTVMTLPGAGRVRSPVQGGSHDLTTSTATRDY